LKPQIFLPGDVFVGDNLERFEIVHRSKNQKDEIEYVLISQDTFRVRIVGENWVQERLVHNAETLANQALKANGSKGSFFIRMAYKRLKKVVPYSRFQSPFSIVNYAIKAIKSQNQ
jgi:hypothetical protein